MTGKYHLKRIDRAMTDENEISRVINEQKFMTIAMCKDNEAYLVTVNHAFDKSTNSFYFHCAQEGKKIDFIKANPLVWGQILEDMGYSQGDCDHAYRTVQFKGRAELISDIEEKRQALELMIEGLEEEPEKCKKEFITRSELEKVAICRIDIMELSGKENIIKEED